MRRLSIHPSILCPFSISFHLCLCLHVPVFLPRPCTSNWIFHYSTPPPPPKKKNSPSVAKPFGLHISPGWIYTCKCGTQDLMISNKFKRGSLPVCLLFIGTFLCLSRSLCDTDDPNLIGVRVVIDYDGRGKHEKKEEIFLPPPPRHLPSGAMQTLHLHVSCIMIIGMVAVFITSLWVMLCSFWSFLQLLRTCFCSWFFHSWSSVSASPHCDIFNAKVE